MQIPPLAGLATYEEAARVGYGVAENVTRFCGTPGLKNEPWKLGFIGWLLRRNGK